MKALIVRNAAALAFGAAALYSASSASADNVVMQPAQPAQAAPAQAPVVVNSQPAQPAPVVVGATAPQPSSPVVVNNADGPRADRSEHYTRPNRALLMTGLIVAGAPYIASMGVAATSGHAGDSDLWIPAIGPWLDLGQRGGCPANGDCGAETANKALLIGDGVLQSVGVLQILGAFIFPETYGGTVYNTASGASLTLTPAKLGRDSYGLSALGTF
ncbi:MAG: hypothetical protein M3O36_13700 [Myxococcota bacterium]|nr:hypothetical protein [Myxococcota bacterium]